MSTSPPPQQVYKKAKPSPKFAEVFKTEVYATVEKKYIVSEATLDALVAGYNSIFSVFFGVLAGVAGVLWGFWSQCTTEPTKRYYASFAFISSVLSVICGVIFIINYVHAYRKKKSLYANANLISP